MGHRRINQTVQAVCDGGLLPVTYINGTEEAELDVARAVALVEADGDDAAFGICHRAGMISQRRVWNVFSLELEPEVLVSRPLQALPSISWGVERLEPVRVHAFHRFRLIVHHQRLTRCPRLLALAFATRREPEPFAGRIAIRPRPLHRIPLQDEMPSRGNVAATFGWRVQYAEIPRERAYSRSALHLIGHDGLGRRPADVSDRNVGAGSLPA